MEYNDFKKEFVTLFFSTFEKRAENDDILSTCKLKEDIIKKNNATLDAIVCLPSETSMGVVFYVNDSYNKYLESEDLSLEVDKLILHVKDEVRSVTLKSSKLTTIRELTNNNPIQYIKDNLGAKFKILPCLMQVKGNEDFLKVHCNRRFLNLAIIYRIIDLQGAEENVQASIPVTVALANEIGYTEPDLFEEGVKNIGAEFMPIISPMQEIISSFEHDSDFKVPVLDMLVITNKLKMFGANALLCTDVFKFIANKSNVNLFILPCSINEIIVLPDPKGTGENRLELLEMVTDVNRNCVEAEEILTNAVYYYDRKKNEISVLAE